MSPREIDGKPHRPRWERRRTRQQQAQRLFWLYAHGPVWAARREWKRAWWDGRRGRA